MELRDDIDFQYIRDVLLNPDRVIDKIVEDIPFKYEVLKNRKEPL